MLETVFKAIINMSISASVAAVLIVLFRGIAGKKMPRIFIYTLWSIVLLRLVCPFFFRRCSVSIMLYQCRM
ncbi:MAG TPA: M56 family metallopeptidase [Acetivibrio sp.]|nr:M56 family metallopeptidase [Acetivibrio sp.]